MENPADVVLWVAVAALLLVVLWRSLGWLRAALRVVRTAAEPRHRREVLAPVLLSTLAGLALAATPMAPSAAARGEWLPRLLAVALGLGVTWTFAGLLSIGVRTLLQRYDLAVADNLTARRMHTQYRVLLRIALILVWVLGAAIVLSTVPAVRALGNGLLASAGIVSLVVGLAAQRTLGNFLAGIQIALSQPIRLDDAVVIEGEWGWIEDITTTYIVVRIWDERRLIVPFSKLLEQPFQNWTRTRAEILGSVSLWADYGVQVAALRQELQRVVQETELWDGRVAVLQVVESSERAIELRALVSASTSPRAWDLRCHVREKLVAFLAAEQPHALPRMRAELESSRRARAESPAPLAVDPTLAVPDVGGLPGEPELSPTPSPAPEPAVSEP
ncbi:MAG: mechanosensitive ion channel [Planctomycetes bacterium]|nr:mechanosensitive ion channel [Planctomycetota bacterium]